MLRVRAIGFSAVAILTSGVCDAHAAATENTVPMHAVVAATAPPEDQIEQKSMLDGLSGEKPAIIVALYAADRAVDIGAYLEAIASFEDAKSVAAPYARFHRRYGTALFCQGRRALGLTELSIAVAQHRSATNLGYLAMATGSLSWPCEKLTAALVGGDGVRAFALAREAASLAVGEDQLVWLGVAAEMAVRGRDLAGV